MAISVALASWAGPLPAQSVDPNLWVTNGPVNAVVRSGNTLYVGGSFSQVGPPTGGAVSFDSSSTGTPVSGFLKVVGTVRAIVQDQFGGWYIGGNFSSVGGVPRSNIAYLSPGGGFSVSSWNPGANATVWGLAVSGSTVYAVGDFGSIGGQPRNYVAALDATTGLATAWNPNANLGTNAVIVSGSTIYVCGSFTSIGGQTRNHIAAVDATSGLATAWNPDANSHVLTMMKVGSTIYAGGDFVTIGGQNRNFIAALDAATGLATAWNPGADWIVETLAGKGTRVYAGGDFASIGGASRTYLAEIDATTGSATGWNPNPNNPVHALAVSGGTIYAGGAFTSIGGQARNRFAGVDLSSGFASSWNPNMNGDVYAVSVGPPYFYAGGGFTSAGGLTRNSIAALDATTGAATAWNPNATGPSPAVNTLALQGSAVCAGGSFTGIGGQPRNNIAALDAATGLATAWNPNANSIVHTLAVNGSTVYVGGEFGTIGGQTRNWIAALDASTGAATSWNPNANSEVDALAVSASVIYAGGYFSGIGGQTRNRIAALDAVTGAATSWNANASGGASPFVNALVLSGGTVYTGGSFANIGGQPRANVAALDAVSGAATGWNPNADQLVRALAVSGTTVYAAGNYTFIGGQSRKGIAALDVSTGLATAWNPNPRAAFVDALAVFGATIYAGGQFDGMGGVPESNVAKMTASPALTSIVPSAGGNTGPLTVTVYGSGLAPAPSILTLTRSGQPDIVGSGAAVAADGTSLSATLNLAGALAGAWNVVVTGFDAQAATLPNGFTVEAVEAPQLRVSVVGAALQGGNPSVRRDRRTAFDLVVENPGNVDALSVPLWLAGIPLDATVERDFAMSYPASGGGGEPNWSAPGVVPLFFTSAGGKYVPLVLPRVPPGTTTRRLYLTVPGPSHPPFTLTAAVTPPWADGNKFRSCIAAGGIGDVSCMGTRLDAINASLASDPSIVAMSGIAIWAKEAYVCEGAGTLGATLAKAEQVLDYLEAPVEGGGAAAGCEDVLLARWGDARTISVKSSLDPNDKLGAQGTLSVRQALPYSIRFENVASASAAAQDVVISDQLSAATMDLTTVSLDQIAFGSTRIYPPPGLSSYSTQVDLRPAQNLLVNVAVSLDPFTHILSWYLNSIDPATGTTPANLAVGVLPPNVTPPQGEGSVLFTVMPLAGATAVSNAAAILFDDPPATATPSWANGLDNTPPASHVLPLTAQSNQPTIPVSWAVDAATPDLRDYTIYVKEDAGPYRVWRLNTTATSDTLGPPKDHHFHSYSFYSVARDQLGNIESPPASPPDPGATTQSTTAVGLPDAPPLALEGARPNPSLGGALTVAFTLPSKQPTTLELLDVAGRRLLRREVGSLGPGAHVVTLAPLPSPRAGLYFLRLVQGHQVLTSRIALIR